MERSLCESVRKWDQGRKTVRRAVHGEDSRSFVPKDFVIFVLCYAIPPLVVLNRFADYPLSFNGKPALFALGNTVLLFLVLLNVICPGHQLSGFERYGPLIIYIFRSVSVSYMEAVNKKCSIKLELERYPIVTAEGVKTTAAAWFTDIEAKSHFSSKVQWLSPRELHMSVLSVVLAGGLMLVPPVQRAVDAGSAWAAFGGGFLEGVVVVLSNVEVFIMACMLLRAFFKCFAFFRSMTNGMSRFKASTVGSYYDSSRVTHAPSMVVDITAPDNLRAWMNVHDGLHRRQDSLEATMISLAAGGTLVLLAVAAAFVVFTPYTVHTVEVASDVEGEAPLMMQKVAGALSSPSLAAILYLVVVLGVSLVVLTWVGDKYNRSSKAAMINHLYKIQLYASLDLHCDSVKDFLPPAREKQLETTTKLLPVIRSHVADHVHELGLFSFSYSHLFYVISTMVTTMVTKYLFRMF